MVLKGPIIKAPKVPSHLRMRFEAIMRQWLTS
jgi:hypothetical protein